MRPQGASGKTVWFTLPAPPPAVGLPPRPAYGTKTAAPPATGPCLRKRPALVLAEGLAGHPRTPARLPAVG